MELRFLESERARFGYRLARLNLDFACESADAERIVDLCQSSNVEMLILRVPTDKIALVQALESLGFRSMDCLVYYECLIQDKVCTKPCTLKIREATSEDAIAVGEIARFCFSEYLSHYHADRRLIGQSDGRICRLGTTFLSGSRNSRLRLPADDG